MACTQAMPELPGAAGSNTCGDGVVQVGEPCDDGNAVETDGCLSNCNLNACGDGSLYVGVEECDDGNVINQDECKNDCTWSFCGDGTVRLDLAPTDPGYEMCDDHNQSNSDDCTNQCTQARCGDNYRQNDETCDDGNLEPGDGCDPNCQKECGNGRIDPNEACDDGNDDNGDGCPATCLQARCGDGHRRTDLGEDHPDGEACDDGNTVQEDGCLNDCTVARCGDSIVRQDVAVGQPGYEGCDDGNSDNNDACPDTCQPARCGDGFRRADLSEGERGYEACDDGNEDNTDTCRNCALPTCGDGQVDPLLGEACDGSPTCDPNTCQPQVTELAFGENFGCAARADGSVLCWPPPNDPNQMHQPNLADGAPIGSARLVNSVPAVPLHKLAASGQEICAISGGENPDLAGRVYCWGNTSNQMLARVVQNGNPYDPVARPIVNAAQGTPQFQTPIQSVQTSLSYAQACLIDAGGRIFCWGGYDSEFWTQFPDFDTELNRDPHSSRPQMLLPETSGVRALAVGVNGLCFIDVDHRAQCVGSNNYFKLGNGSDTTFSATPVMVQGLPAGNMLHIAAGADVYCALAADQTVSCWGNNEQRQVGYFERIEQGTAFQHPNIDQATNLNLTLATSCSLRLGQMYCWGKPQFGPDFWFEDGVNLPQRMEGLPEGAAIASIHRGGMNVCALTTDHRAYCWGNNYGNLFGSLEERTYTTAVELEVWSQEPEQP